MSRPSHVLVIEPSLDPDIERALESLGADLHIATTIKHALELSRDLHPAIILFDARYPEGDCWRLIAEIWESAKVRPHPPALILLADDAASWTVNRFGPVRFSDRQHLRQAFREILEAPHDGHALDHEQDTAWEAVRNGMKARGDERFKSEFDRMRRLGIVDEGGRATSKDRPADMRPGSRTEVAT